MHRLQGEACQGVPESPKSRTSLWRNRDDSGGFVDARTHADTNEEEPHAHHVAEVVEDTYVSIHQHALRALELYAQFIRTGSPYEVSAVDDSNVLFIGSFHNSLSALKVRCS